MSPFSERLSRSRYLHLGFHASISETQEQTERESEREREKGRKPRREFSRYIRCILPTSYNSFFALLLVSRYTRSTAARTFRGRSSHYACPIYSMFANGHEGFGDRECISTTENPSVHPICTQIFLREQCIQCYAKLLYTACCQIF